MRLAFPNPISTASYPLQFLSGARIAVGRSFLPEGQRDAGTVVMDMR